ncbi:UvrD-helicase domain-containing protein, partial [Acinetobacter baumannii]|nr:UvrD-helicase domain-containing protein [Acinetobacter baumannii]
SGKTTTLVARIGYMIYGYHINPKNILVMTYTLAASNDMKSRFVKVFGDTYADSIKFSAINSICAGIINYYNPNAFTLVPNN